MTKTEHIVHNLIKLPIEDLGYELYDVEYVKEGKDYFLRVYIDSKNGINLDDCERVSNIIDPILDEADPISTSYSLEVSSCGLERHLREKEHYIRAIGEKVEIKLFKPFENEKQYVGKLKDANEKTITLELENDSQIEFKMDDIATAKILYNWEELENE